MPFGCTLVSNWLVCSKLALVGVLMRYLLFLLRGRLLLVFMGGQKSNFLMIIKWHWAAINHHENSVLLSFEVRYSLLDHFNFITYWILNELLKVLIFLAIQIEIADTFLANTHHYIQLHDHSFYLHILYFYSWNVFSFSI